MPGYYSRPGARGGKTITEPSLHQRQYQPPCTLRELIFAVGLPLLLDLALPGYTFLVLLSENNATFSALEKDTPHYALLSPAVAPLRRLGADSHDSLRNRVGERSAIASPKAVPRSVR